MINTTADQVFVNLKLTPDPIDSVLSWIGEAEAANIVEPTAMSLATATKAGRPSARIVLFKGLSVASDGRRAPRFFTNYSSRKSAELLENPFAALVLYWAPMNRQIRIEGRIEKLSNEESTAYFHSRPHGSQIGAWASPQSQKIKSRDELMESTKKIDEKFKSGEVPLPDFWGGWRVVPEKIEFWQAGDFRLHDRFLYEWDAGKWSVSRLAP